MSKENSTIRQSDLIEMLNRNKVFLFDLQDFSNRNQAEITLRISIDGNISFQTVEKTDEYIHWKSLDQKESNYKYTECRNKR